MLPIQGGAIKRYEEKRVSADASRKPRAQNPVKSATTPDGEHGDAKPKDNDGALRLYVQRVILVLDKGNSVLMDLGSRTACTSACGSKK